MQQALFDVEGGVGDRGRLQSVAQRLVVEVNTRARPVEAAVRAACAVPIVDKLPLLHGLSVAQALA